MRRLVIGLIAGALGLTACGHKVPGTVTTNDNVVHQCAYLVIVQSDSLLGDSESVDRLLCFTDMDGHGYTFLPANVQSYTGGRVSQ